MLVSACTSSPSRCRSSTSSQASCQASISALPVAAGPGAPLCSDGPPSGGVLNAFPHPLGHIVVDPDPGHIVVDREYRTVTLDLVLRLCRVAAESTGSRGHLAPLVQHAVEAGERGALVVDAVTRCQAGRLGSHRHIITRCHHGFAGAKLSCTALIAGIQSLLSWIAISNATLLDPP
jgi:hypothetical protein